jgi:hypothetical protein
MVENDLSGCIGCPLNNGLAGILVRVFYRAGLAVINIKCGLAPGSSRWIVRLPSSCAPWTGRRKMSMKNKVKKISSNFFTFLPSLPFCY